MLTFEFSGSFISYRTGHYKLHYYETPTSLKFVMVTDTKTNNLRIVLHQIYVGLYVEYGELGVVYLLLNLLRYENLEWIGARKVRGTLPLDMRANAREILVVKNPLSPVEHPGGVGVNCEMFNLGLEQFIVSFVSF